MQTLRKVEKNERRVQEKIQTLYKVLTDVDVREADKKKIDCIVNPEH